VVLSVNGLPIERPEHAYRIWQELRVASDLRVEYLRAGQPRSIEYTIGDS
jgi:type II secretory pathway component PulC